MLYNRSNLEKEQFKELTCQSVFAQIFSRDLVTAVCVLLSFCLPMGRLLKDKEVLCITAGVSGEAL